MQPKCELVDYEGYHQGTGEHYRMGRCLLQPERHDGWHFYYYGYGDNRHQGSGEFAFLLCQGYHARPVAIAFCLHDLWIHCVEQRSGHKPYGTIDLKGKTECGVHHGAKKLIDNNGCPLVLADACQQAKCGPGGEVCELADTAHIDVFVNVQHVALLVMEEAIGSEGCEIEA